MRHAFLLGLAPLALASACSSSAHTTTIPDAGGDGASGDGGGQTIPKTEACTGTTTDCLYGTAKTTGFTTTAKRMQASLYKVFPSGSAPPLKTIPVALDGTWAFSDVASLSNETSWSHYYVQVAADFGDVTADGGAVPAPARVVGPFTLPSTGPLPSLEVPPVQIALLENAAGGAFQVDWVEALVFDPATGAPVTGTASVSVSVGGTSTPMPWGTAPGGQAAYFVQFSTPPAAQTTYTVTTTATTGGTAATWSLVAATPAFTPNITAPAAGASVPANMDLSVTWPQQLQADYVIVELFDKNMQGQWASAYNSPQSDPPDTTSERVPGADLAAAGTYLVDVNFANASCPPTAGGCVLASTAATAQITAQ